MVRLLYQLLTPELGSESLDTRSAAAAVAPAAMSLQNICVKITWATVQELKSDRVITSPHSSISEFLNNVPSEACMSTLKKGRNFCSVCSKWHCHLECPVSPAVLLFCAPYKLRLSNSLPLQLIQHELSQASAEQYCGFPFHFRLSLLSTMAPPCSRLCCTPSPGHSTGCSWQKIRHTVKPECCPPGTTGTVQTR